MYLLKNNRMKNPNLQFLPFREKFFLSRTHCFFFFIYLFFLSIYLAFVTYLTHCNLFVDLSTLPLKLALFVTIAVLIAFILILTCRLGSTLINKAVFPKNSQTKIRIIASLAFIVSFAILLVTFASCKPGAVNYDISNQWQQAQTNQFNNWHPVFHTLWIWLLTRITNQYALLVIVQILLFSVVAAFLAKQLYLCNLPGWLVLVLYFVIITSKSVRNTMMYIGKDAMMTISSTALSCALLEILRSGGAWLKRTKNAVFFGITIAFVSLIRQNAVFFVFPILLVVFLLCSKNRRNFLVVISSAVTVLIAVKCLLYPCLDIIYPNNTAEESIGLPMTVLADAYTTTPEILDDDTVDFLQTLASNEIWQQKYRPHQYNSIKFEFDREHFKQNGLLRIFDYAWNTAKVSPRSAWESIFQITRLVWSIDGDNVGYQLLLNSGDLKYISPESGRIQTFGRSAVSLLDKLGDLPPVAYFTNNIGVEMLFLLLCGLLATYKKGIGPILVVAPIVLYNLCTMLMLCGNDARFFHFSMFLCYPLGFALLFYSSNSKEHSSD